MATDPPAPPVTAVTETEPIVAKTPEATSNDGDPTGGITWWMLLLVGLGTAGTGVITTAFLSRKKKR